MKIISAIFLTLLMGQSLAAETVSIDHNGQKLNASLESVSGNWPDGPVILMTHGTLAHGNMDIMSGLQTMFRDMGISTLSITLGLGLDDRSGMYDCNIPHRHRHADAVEEIGLWHDWLKQQGVQNIVLLGHSRGGNQTARYALQADDDSISRVYLLAPSTWSDDERSSGYEKRYGTPLQPLLDRAQAMIAVGNGEHWMENIDFLYCENTSATAYAFDGYYANDGKMDTPALLPEISYPVTVFAGSADDTVKALIPKMEQLTESDNIALHIIDGAGHFFRDLYSDEIVEIISDEIAEE